MANPPIKSDPKANPIFQKVVKKFLATKPQPKTVPKKARKGKPTAS